MRKITSMETNTVKHGTGRVGKTRSPSKGTKLRNAGGAERKQPPADSAESFIKKACRTRSFSWLLDVTVDRDV